MRREASVPARINIIGEHTDHFGGLSLPFASQHRLHLIANSRSEGFSGEETVVRLWKTAGGWPADLEVKSQIPVGAGMSSSAALCVAVVLCARGMGDKMETCTKAQRLEHQVIGSSCGLMDQIAITHASRGQAVFIDFSDLSVDNFNIPEDWCFKLVDTGIRRNLRDTDYSGPMTSSHAGSTHALKESERVREALNCDAPRLGKLLNQSHASLRDVIRVSTPEIDAIVRDIQATRGVYGARLMGGGFGGMILALVENDQVLHGKQIVPSEPAFFHEEL